MNAPTFARFVKALDALDEVIALIRASEPSTSPGRLIELLDIDEFRPRPSSTCSCGAWRLGAPAHHRRPGRGGRDRRPGSILANRSDSAGSCTTNSPRSSKARRRSSHPDHRGRRRRQRRGPDRPRGVVVTITEPVHQNAPRPLYAAKTRRKGVQGARLKQDDIVAHFFVSSTHDWILLHHQGRVYRAKATSCRGLGQRAVNTSPTCCVPARGAHRPGHPNQRPRRRPVSGAGHQKRLGQEVEVSTTSSNRSANRATNLRDGDELVGACRAATNDLPLVGQANPSGSRRPTRRSAMGGHLGVQGMRFNADDPLCR